ncbi:Eukaryotic translation initiation factor 3 135 kDa subunit [Actinacidiphila cocklensis]|uniref:Eukaryotic translation initiation factor 3 135 kDa subunit n=1 Tax=Actinacidiphila cocklensis TaxID=887465 RepID=A0A9W4E595_9ACTN|nr:Eukaryotic translation initiation factor 3 135 kDa subunit [Actinacidiphila cocklensis]
MGPWRLRIDPTSQQRPSPAPSAAVSVSRKWTLRARDPFIRAGQRAAAEPYRPGADPQLLHHRAHRPRQVDARRPHAPAHRRRRRAADACAVPRPDGHRA